MRKEREGTRALAGEIDEEHLVFTNFVLENAQDFDNMFFRLVLITYIKTDKASR